MIEEEAGGIPGEKGTLEIQRTPMEAVFPKEGSQQPWSPDIREEPGCSCWLSQDTQPRMMWIQLPQPAINPCVSFSDLTGEQGDVHLVLCDISRVSPWHPR